MMIALFWSLSSLSLASAHIALWDPGMFGLNYPYQSTDTSNYNWNNNQPVNPLREMDGLTQSQWFGHGLLGYPPAPGNFMTLPAGGTYTGEHGCNRAGTSLRDPSITGALPTYACDGVGALHVMNQFNQTADPQWFGGTALAIAYTSDETSVQPNDFTVISVNQNTVWYRSVSYSIPAGLPACPSGGCLCTWNWIHEANHGEGYPFEIYNVMYRCQVTGATSTAPVMRGAVPVECSANPSTCVSGPKTPMYLYQADGNNMAHVDNPPNYKNNYGFNDGAQNDIFQAAASPAPTTYQYDPYATPTSTQSGYNRPTPTATTLPSGWISLGCNVDQNSPRALLPGAYTSSSTGMSWSYCVNYCAGQNLNYAGVENGNECWCSNTVTLNSANASDCNAPCTGDQFATCGGGWRIQVFLNVYAPTTTSSVSPVPFPTAALPAGWSDMGCSVDDGTYRALNRGATQFPTNNTVPNCIATCSSQGWPYAGVEYGKECWCGDVANITAATGCNMACSGDPGSDCGGSYRINVYKNNAAASTSVSTTTSSVVSTGTSLSTGTTGTGTGTTGTGTTGTGTTGTSPAGTGATGTGTTGTGATGTSPTGTGATGTGATGTGATGTGATGTGTTGTGATGTGATGTGTTGTGTTGTGTTGTGTTGTGATGTGATGTGATGTGTGSTSTPSTSPSSTPTQPTTSVPSTTPSPTTPKPTSPSTTSPSTTPSPTSPSTTPKPTSPSTSPSSTTSTTSTPSTTSKPSTTSTSTTPTSTPTPTPTGAVVLPTGWKVAGCVADSTSKRVLSGASGTSTVLTPNLCAQWCASKKFTWAGTESGNTCYCGNAFTVTNTTGCVTPCTGAKTVACGGTLRLSVYNKPAGKRDFEVERRLVRFGRDAVAVSDMTLDEYYAEVYSKLDLGY